MEEVQRKYEVQFQLFHLSKALESIDKDLKKCQSHQIQGRRYMIATLKRMRQNLVRLEKLGLAFRKSSIAYEKAVENEKD